MKMTATDFGKPTYVWDYARSRKVDRVLWVDEEKSLYSTTAQPMRVVNNAVVEDVHYAPMKVFNWGLIVINPPPGFDHATAVSLYDLIKT